MCCSFVGTEAMYDFGVGSGAECVGADSDEAGGGYV